MILELCPPEQRLEAVKEKNKYGDTLLIRAATNPELFKMILEIYPPEQQLEAVKERDSYGQSLLFREAAHPESFKMILKLYPPEQRLEALNEKTGQGKTLLGRIYIYFPKTYELLLNVLPEEIAFVFKEREKDLGSKSNEVLAYAISIEQFMKDMQGLAKPEAIKNFVQAIVKNENIEVAKKALLTTDNSTLFFKSNNLEAIHQCIEKIYPYWSTGIQLPQPETIQPKIQK